MKDTTNQEKRIEVKCIGQSFAGVQHILEKKESEDVMRIDETSDFFFAGLADGQGGKQYCREGGLACLRQLAAYLKKNRHCAAEFLRIPR